MGGYKFGKGIPTWNGVPMISGLPVTEGKYFYVNYGTGSDGNRGTSIDRPFKTIDKAYDSATTNKNDVICLMGNSSHVLTEMLSVTKNRVHFVGLDGSGGRPYGQNAKVQLGITGVATNLGTMQNTGVRNTFSNIKFINSDTVAEGLFTVVEAGEYAKYSQCEFYKSSHLDASLAAELACNSDSGVFEDCTFGSTANVITAGAIIRPCVMLTKTLVAGKFARDVTFRDCRFWRVASNAANAFVWSTTATDVERVIEFRDCVFNTTKKSVGTPAVAIGGASAFTAGEILLTGSTCENGCTALATQTGIISALPTYAAAGGSGIQAT